MDRLPVEIWSIIVAQTNKQDWLVLSRTCKVENVTLHVYSITLPNSPRCPDLSNFQTLITNQPELGALVHKFSIYHGGWPQPCMEPCGWLSLLPNFSNLEVLYVDGFYINSSFSITLHSLDLPCLRTLFLVGCVVDITHLEAPTAPGTLNLVSELVLHESDLMRTPPPVLCPGLQRLTISTHVWWKDQGDKFLSACMLAGATFTLTSLNINVISEALLRFLESSPQLRHLELTFAIAFTPLGELSTDAIPLLETFGGPAEYAAMFVRGRPVRTAKLRLDPTAPFDILQPLHHSSVGITTCALFLNLKHPQMGAIFQSVPHTLRHLTWDTVVVWSKWEVESWISALPHLPNLHVLESCVEESWDYHAALVDTSSELVPSLKEFTFRCPSGLCDRWLRKRDGNWERYISQMQ